MSPKKDHERKRFGMAMVTIILAIFMSTQSCYQYRVLNTASDPATEYEEKILKSYAWGLINKPKDFHLPNCDSLSGIDEVLFSKNTGQYLLTMITLGYISNVKVRWRCHKPCERIDSI